jgi:hypothetical protein
MGEALPTRARSNASDVDRAHVDDRAVQPIAPAPGGVIVRGRVVETDGRPVVLARVTLSGMARLVTYSAQMPTGEHKLQVHGGRDDLASAVTDEDGQYRFELDSRTAERAEHVSCIHSLEYGDLPLPSPLPDAPLDDIVLGPVGMPAGLPDIQLRPVDAATGRPLTLVSGRVSLLAGEEVVGSALCRTDQLGEAHLWEAPEHRPADGTTFARAMVRWTIDGYLDEEHEVQLVGQNDGAIIVQRVTPRADSFVVRGRVLRQGQPVAGIPVVVQISQLPKPEQNPWRSTHMFSDTEGSFELRATCGEGEFAFVFPVAPEGGEWDLIGPRSELAGSVLECVLELEPLRRVPVEVHGAQPGVQYDYQWMADVNCGTAGRRWISSGARANPLDLEGAGHAEATLLLPPDHRAKVTVRGWIDERRVSEHVCTFDWSPDAGSDAAVLELSPAFARLAGSVTGVPDVGSERIAVVLGIGHCRFVPLQPDRTFELFVARGRQELWLVRLPEAWGEAELLAKQVIQLDTDRVGIVLAPDPSSLDPRAGMR